MRIIIYDAVKEKAKFDKNIAKLERKLTKARQKGQLRREEKLQKRVAQLARERLDDFTEFEANGFGQCEREIKYNENGEAKIFIEFKKRKIVELSTEELIERLGGKSLNKQDEESRKQEDCGKEAIIPGKNFSSLEETCSYDCADNCGCDYYGR